MLIARWIAGVGMLMYGSAKITGAQFVTLLSESDRPLRDVSGFWLTWYYFGHAPAYKYSIAALEITAGLLLLFRRTSLMGACVTAAMLVNVLLIDLSFGVDLGGTAAAFVLLWLSVAVIAEHRDALVRVFWRERSNADPRWFAAHPYLISTGILLACLGAQVGIVRWNNRLPTPVDGVWDAVTRVPGAPDTVYFEPERAHLCVFGIGDQREPHQFDYSATNSSIVIRRRWLDTSSEVIYSGSLQPNGDLRLTSATGGNALVLKRALRP